MTRNRSAAPWYLWPFAASWNLLTILLDLTGRLVAVMLGAVLMLAGGLLCLTVIGVVVGIPLAILGLVIVLRGLF
jgi:hypothetical protein